MCKMQVYLEEAIKYDGSSLSACRLSLKWCGEDDLKPLEQKIILEGSMGTKFLLLQYTPPSTGTCLYIVSIHDGTLSSYHAYNWMC